jgi:cytochrome c oxidase subunit 4
MSEHAAHKVITIPWMIVVYIALMLLLALTIFAAHVSLGLLGLAIALAIAAAKSLLVILYYMHIRVESPVTRIFALAGFVWLSIMLTLTAGDYLSRPWLYRAEEVNRGEPMLIPPPPGMSRESPQSRDPVPFDSRYK